MIKKIDPTLYILKGLFKKPATILKKSDEAANEQRIRGLIGYDSSACVACGLCMKDCPTGALNVVNKGTKAAKEMHAYLDTGRCIFCGQCADSCAKHCISSTPHTDLSGASRDGLIIEL